MYKVLGAGLVILGLASCAAPQKEPTVNSVSQIREGSALERAISEAPKFIAPGQRKLAPEDLRALETLISSKHTYDRIERLFPNVVIVEHNFSFWHSVKSDTQSIEARGTGFFVTPKLVLTSMHVVSEPSGTTSYSSLRLRAPQDSSYRWINGSVKQVVFVSPQHDLALIEAEDSFNDFVPVSISKESSTREGIYFTLRVDHKSRQLYAGNASFAGPLGACWESDSYPSTMLLESEVYVVPIASGNSGSPVFNAYGQLQGVTSMSSGTNEVGVKNILVASPSISIRKVLQSYIAFQKSLKTDKKDSHPKTR